MTAPGKAGPFMPTHRYGHCLYDPTLSGKVCNAPADLHLWVGGQSDPDAFTTFTCLGHAERAKEALDPLDWHRVNDACIARRHWNFTGTPGNSWCFDLDDESAAVESLREVTA